MSENKTDGDVLLEIFRNEIRWYHFVTPEARNIVTDRVRTAAVKRLAEAGRVDIGTAEPGYYSVPSLVRGDDEHFAGEAPCCAEGPGSTSPEPGPEPEMIECSACAGIGEQWVSGSISVPCHCEGGFERVASSGPAPEYPCEGAEYGVCGGVPHVPDCPSYTGPLLPYPPEREPGPDGEVA